MAEMSSKLSRPVMGCSFFMMECDYVLPTRVLRLFDVAENESTNGLQYKLYNERKNGIIANFPTF